MDFKLIPRILSEEILYLLIKVVIRKGFWMCIVDFMKFLIHSKVLQKFIPISIK